MTAGFARTARVVSGTTPSPRAVQPYRVTVTGGRLRLALAGTRGRVIDVPLTRVQARPLGRAGSTVVEIDDDPLLVDFTDRAHGAGTLPVVRRVRHAVAGRRARRAFLAAAKRARPEGSTTEPATGRS